MKRAEFNKNKKVFMTDFLTPLDTNCLFYLTRDSDIYNKLKSY